MDTIIVKDLMVRNIIGVDNWERMKRQPVLVSLYVYTHIQNAGESDLLSQSVHYGILSKEAIQFSESSTYKTVEALAIGLCIHLMEKFESIFELKVRVEKPKALLHAKSAGVEIKRSRADLSWIKGKEPLPSILPNDLIFVHDLEISTIVGVNPWEREQKQKIICQLTIYPSYNFHSVGDVVLKPHNYRTIARTVEDFIEKSRYKTVEALATSIAKLCIEKCLVRKITVRIEKPSALLFAQYAGIEITRTEKDFKKAEPVNPEWHTVFIAFGTNLKNRYENIRNAMRLLEKDDQIKIVDSSFLYETEPKYFLDQPKFLNGALKILTLYRPENLLKSLKRIETEIGRRKTIENGPREIDLDILFYDKLIMETSDLIIPHPRIQERQFVLLPLADIAPDFWHPKLNQTIKQLLSLLPKEEEIFRVTPLLNDKLIYWGKKTQLMAILNVTPDSFSDGGQYNQLDNVKKYFQQLMSSPNKPDFIDIGGCSTRPNAAQVSVEEERQRVMPVIDLLVKELNCEIPLSIDTFHASIAKEACERGVSIINDVTGGEYDPEMRKVSAELGAPIVLMHMRGDSQTMMQMNHYKNSLLQDVKSELLTRVEKAINCGVRRWQIILDPGIGFSKDLNQNLELFRNLNAFINQPLDHTQTPYLNSLQNFPLLIGPSRKGFIGKILNQSEPKDRIWGTAAICSICASHRVDILRVHDVEEMSQVVKMTDAVLKQKK